MIEILLWFVSLNWGLTLLFWVYPLVMWLVFKDFVFDGWHGPFAKFRLATKKDTDDPIEPWHAKAWSDWWGVGFHWYMCYRYPHKKGELHEGGHCWHQFFLGMLFWLLYFGHMGWIALTQKLLKPGLSKGLLFRCKCGKCVTSASYSTTICSVCRSGTTEKMEPYPYTKHAYLDIWSERLARKRAGQQVDIPPSQWPSGPKDLFPWF